MLPLLMIPFVNFPCESFTAREHPRGFKSCLLLLIGLVALIWGLGGRGSPHNAYFTFFSSFFSFTCENPDIILLFQSPLWGELTLDLCALTGAAFIFSAYQPNYDPTTADGLYCNKNLYTFAFWNAVLEMFSLGMILVKHCKSVMVGVSISPTPGYSNV